MHTKPHRKNLGFLGMAPTRKKCRPRQVCPEFSQSWTEIMQNWAISERSLSDLVSCHGEIRRGSFRLNKPSAHWRLSPPSFPTTAGGWYKGAIGLPRHTRPPGHPQLRVVSAWGGGGGGVVKRRGQSGRDTRAFPVTSTRADPVLRAG